ncbi:proteoglycan 4a [Centropristis striata]|uniref:proteoglycan 4a n=1 Tax=Centropristis striata TaxID=184440 RepID=UPI0027DFE8CA|nr:proteoglycan 4a [Centropristis striata]
MMSVMMKMSLWLLLLGPALTAAGPGSCVGRCGELFSRGRPCSCDFSCLQHNECCSDYQDTCTAARSCQGRCTETFQRGRLCDCDPQCIQYNTCCHDYQTRCDAGPVQSQRASSSGNRRGRERNWRRSNSDSEEWYTARGLCSQYPGGQCPSVSSDRTPPALPSNPRQHGVSNIPVGLLPASLPSSHHGAPDPPAPGSFLPHFSAPSLGVPDHLQLVSGPGGVAPSGPGLSTLQDVAQALGLSQGPGTGLPADVNLCSDSPINGLTALSNGTILIFKGDLFWSVDPSSRSVGPPQSITDSLGVPSPIDTVFTRCNCHGNTYIIKGDQYWRLDGNMRMEPGYPRPLVSEFPGLAGGLSAALAVPATRTRPETVFFFKNGDTMQTFTFPAGSTPSCSMTPRSSPTGRLARQAVLLRGEINIRVSLKGFPAPVTSALSMPSPQRSDPFQHYVFSGPLFFSVQISGDLPALTTPPPSAIFAPLPLLSPAAANVATNAANVATNPPLPLLPANSIRVWLRCP